MKDISRREFLKALGRIAVLGGIGLAGITLARGRSIREFCINRGICRGCTVYAGCELPPALSAKRSRGDG